MQKIGNKTGLIYDERMVEHRCLWARHPESPQRFTGIIERITELGLIDRCKKLTPREATLNEILSTHSNELYNLLKSTKNADIESLEELSAKFVSIYLHPKTFELALLAAGSTIELVDKILSNEITNGMAVVRPPGHHAMESEFNGFCFFNNVAMAAKYALNEKGIKRILIVDWDVHHGQGTQRFFYDDSRVLYFSIHRFQFGTYWPHLLESDFDYVGREDGCGFNFNVPLNETGIKNGEYLAIFQQILLPVAMEFQPELILVSAGFDSALGCSLGQMHITPACYAHLLRPLQCLANGKIAIALEGGYCVDSLAEGVAITLKTLLGDPCPRLIEPLELPRKCIQESILNCIYSHRPYWKCFQMFDVCNSIDCKSQNAHKVVRRFEYPIQPPVERYPTRYPYPEYDEELRTIINNRLDMLKKSTNLGFPTNRISYSLDKTVCSERMVSLFNDQFKQVPDREARVDELLLVYSKEWLKSAETSKQLFENVGALLQIVDSVLDNSSQNGICINQSIENEPKNINNALVAAQYAIKQKGIQRCLLINWTDKRHVENEKLLKSMSNVLYVTIYSSENSIDELNWNKDQNENFIVNIPLQQSIDYTTIFQRFLIPIAYQYDPDFVILSGQFVSQLIPIDNFGHLLHWISTLANGKIIINLEGSQNNEMIINATSLCLNVLSNIPMPVNIKQYDDFDTKMITKQLVSNYMNYWTFLKYNQKLCDCDMDNKTSDISDKFENLKC